MAGEIGTVSVALRAKIDGLERDIAKARSELQSLGPAASKAGTAATAAFGGLNVGVVAIAAATAAAVSGITLVKRRLDELDQLNKQRQRVGFGAEDFSRLAYAARLADVEVNELSQSLVFFNRQLVEARDPTSQASRLFRALGVDINQGPKAAVLAFADALASMRDGEVKTAVASEVLGARIGSRLIPLFNGGAAAIRAAGDELDRFGGTASDKAAKGAEEFNDNMERLRTAAAAVANVAVERLVPALEKASARLVEIAKSDADERVKATSDAFDIVATAIHGATEALIAYDAARKKYGLLTVLANPAIVAVQPIGEALAENARLEANRRRSVEIVNGRVVQRKETDEQVRARLAAREALRAGTTGGAFVGPPEFIGPPEPPAGPPVDEAAVLKALNAKKDAEEKAAKDAATREQNRLDALVASAQAAYDLARARGASIEELQRRLADLSEAERAAIVGKAAVESAVVDAKTTQLQLSTQQLTTQQQLLALAAEQQATELRFADARTATVDALAEDAAARLAIAEQDGDSRSRLLELAAQADSFEMRSLQTQRDRIQLEIEQLRLREDSAAEIANLEAQQLRLNLALERGPDHVRAMRQEFINLGDTANDVLADFATGLAQGTADFGKAGQQLGQAFITQLIRSTLKEKAVFDFKVKANLLELVGFAGDAGQDGGGNFVSGLISKVSGGVGRLFTGAPTPGTGAAVSAVSTPAPGEPNAGQTFGVTGEQGQSLEAPAGGSSNLPGATQGLDTGGTGSSIVGSIPIIGAIVAAAIGVAQGISDTFDRWKVLAQSVGTSQADLGLAALKGDPIFGKLATNRLVPKEFSEFVATVLGQTPPTGEKQLNLLLSRIFTELGVPTLTGGPAAKGGINVRQFGFPSGGGPPTPIAPHLVELQAAALGVGKLIQQAVPGLPGKGNPAVPFLASQGILNELTALQIATEDAQKIITQLAASTGRSFAEVAFRLAGLRAQGQLTDDQFTDALSQVLQAFGELPPAIDASRLALVALGDDGLISLEALKRVTEDTAKNVGGGIAEILRSQVAGEDTLSIAANVGELVADTMLDRFQERVLQEKLLGKLLTRGTAEIDEAIDLFLAGDKAEARRVRDKAVKDINQGRKDVAEFLEPVSQFIRETNAALSPTSVAALPAFRTTSGFGIPHFAAGGLVTQPTLAMIGEAGPEFVVPHAAIRRIFDGAHATVAHLLKSLSITKPARDVGFHDPGPRNTAQAINRVFSGRETIDQLIRRLNAGRADPGGSSPALDYDPYRQQVPSIRTGGLKEKGSVKGGIFGEKVLEGIGFDFGGGGSASIPYFDRGDMPGAPRLAHATLTHGGTGADYGEMVGLLRTISQHMQGGGVIQIDLTNRTTVEMDGRQIAVAVERNRVSRRAGMVAPNHTLGTRGNG